MNHWVVQPTTTVQISGHSQEDGLPTELHKVQQIHNLLANWVSTIIVGLSGHYTFNDY